MTGLCLGGRFGWLIALIFRSLTSQERYLSPHLALGGSSCQDRFECFSCRLGSHISRHFFFLRKPYSSSSSSSLAAPECIPWGARSYGAEQLNMSIVLLERSAFFVGRNETTFHTVHSFADVSFPKPSPGCFVVAAALRFSPWGFMTSYGVTLRRGDGDAANGGFKDLMTETPKPALLFSSSFSSTQHSIRT